MFQRIVRIVPALLASGYLIFIAAIITSSPLIWSIGLLPLTFSMVALMTIELNGLTLPSIAYLRKTCRLLIVGTTLVALYALISHDSLTIACLVFLLLTIALMVMILNTAVKPFTSNNRQYAAERMRELSERIDEYDYREWDLFLLDCLREKHRR